MDPVHSALHHVEHEFDNQVYGKTRAPTGTSALSICLVNTGKADRAEIATLLTSIDRQNPQLVAVDIVFDKKDAPVDTSLQRALTRLQQQHKLVMASWLTITGEEGNDSTKLHESDAPFQLGLAGYTNFVAEESDGVIRHFLPQLPPETGEKTVTQSDRASFSARIVSMLAPQNWQQYEKHREAMEPNQPDWILYQEDQTIFKHFKAADLLKNNVQLSELNNKIVLLGSMDGRDDLYVSEDVHHVPFGKDSLLTGLEIHANIIAMLLDGTYIRKVSDRWIWLLSFPVCWAMMIFFLWQFQEFHLWFHLVFKTVQFITAALIVLIALLLFRFGHIELNTLPLIVPIALAVDVLYFYEGFARWLTLRLAKNKKWAKRIPYKTFFEDHHAH